VLNHLSLELIDVQSNSALRVPFARGTDKLSGSALDFLNEHFNAKITARELLPFAEVKETFAEKSGAHDGVVAVGFMLKSQFFDVSEWLNSAERPEMTMGPATVRLVIDKDEIKKPVVRTNKPKPIATANANGVLIVRDEKSDHVVKEFPLSQLKNGMTIKPGVTLGGAKAYRHAVVMNNQLSEGDSGEPNPAIELMVQSGGKTIREVAYAKFPNFSLNQGKGGTFGLKFEYQAGASRSVGSENEAAIVETSSEAQGSRAGHVIEFHVTPGGGDRVRVELYKDNQQVLNQTASPGESIATPWMGMRLTLGDVKRNAQAQTSVVEAQVQPRSDLPPSAIFVTTAGQSPDQGFWLAEGQFRRVQILGREYEVYFGRQTFDLPFSIRLLEFTKTDYPGTETPLSFSSRVQVNGHEPETTISMNEPLKYDGYTIYQSSYDLRPGEPRASIFSVNKDPGRAVKYFGALVLAIGIITFTLMRSRVGKARSHV
jgi:hypothetical protein